MLGLSGGYHDAAAALICDGEIVAAVEQERLSRKKHDRSFPAASIRECLRIGGIGADQLDRVAWYERPGRKLSRALFGSTTFSPKDAVRFGKKTPDFIYNSVLVKRRIFRSLDCSPVVEFVDHHLSHASSAFYPSAFPSAAIITCDGVGEWVTNGIWFGSPAGVIPLETIEYPDSLGLFYSAVTQYCGFKPNDGEYKLMGLAAFGRPRLRPQLENDLITLFEDGSYRLNRSCFSFESDNCMFTTQLEAALGFPPRTPDMELRELDRDLAASVQGILEDQLIRQAARARAITGAKHLCLAGGVALNCVANGKIARSGLFEKLWVQPAASDAGGALGAALAVWHRHKRVSPSGVTGQKNSYLGPSYADAEISGILEGYGIPHETLPSTELCERVASALADGQVVGWFQGRMEVGPRALGNRSILADPRRADMQQRVNSKIKHRETFRPFAPVVPEPDAAKFFEMNQPSPFMLEVHDVKRPSGAGQSEPVPLPAVTHFDGTARVQTISEQANPLLFELLRCFERYSGVPVLLNTSFNDADEPIVCTPEQAIRTAKATNLDLLIMGSQLVTKEALATAQLPVQAAAIPTMEDRNRGGDFVIKAFGTVAYMMLRGLTASFRALRRRARDDPKSAWKRVGVDVQNGAYPLY